MQKTIHTARAVGMVMAITAASKAIALLSSQVIAAFFGAGGRMDVYMTALQLPNTVFLSVGTALTTVVIPIFATHLQKGNSEKAFRFGDNITGLTLLTGIILSILGILVSPVIVLFTRFKNDLYGFAVMAFQLMFPLMIFTGLYFIFQGVLQSYGRFAIPAAVSAFSGATIILYTFLFGKKYEVGGLLAAAFIGIALQSLVLIPGIYRAGYRLRPALDFRDEDIRKALKLMVPVILGTSAYQVNMLFNILMSASFHTGPTLLTLMQTLSVNMMLVFIYSMTAVLFPRLTRLAADGDMGGFKRDFRGSVNMMIFLLVPASAGFISVGRQLVELLYMWGKFTADNVTLASHILVLYSIGFVGVGVKEAADRAFYSLNDTKFPMINGIIISVVNIATGLASIYAAGMGVAGLALGYSISFLAGAAILVVRLHRKIGGIGMKNIIITLIKVTIASVAMYLAVSAVVCLTGKIRIDSILIGRAVKLLVPVAAGVLAYSAAALLLRVDQAVLLYSRVVNRVRPARTNT